MATGRAMANLPAPGRHGRSRGSLFAVLAAVILLAVAGLGFVESRAPRPPASPPRGPGPDDVEFVATGLPAGYPWSVTVDGNVTATHQSTLAVALPAGNYSFEVTAYGYVPSPARGTLNTTDRTTTLEEVAFGLGHYALTIAESGLSPVPAGSSPSAGPNGPRTEARSR